jgi:hypothetical protein
VACGMLLLARCLKMAFLPIEWTCLYIPTTNISMAFFLATMINKGCLIRCKPLGMFLLVLVDMLATSFKCWYSASLFTLLITALLQFSTRRMEWWCVSTVIHCCSLFDDRTKYAMSFSLKNVIFMFVEFSFLQSKPRPSCLGLGWAIIGLRMPCILFPSPSPS